MIIMTMIVMSTLKAIVILENFFAYGMYSSPTKTPVREEAE